MASDQIVPAEKANAFRLYNLVQSMPTRGILRGGLRDTLATLALVQGEHDSAWIGNRKLQGRMGCSKTSRENHIHDLRHLGLITREQVEQKVHTTIREDRLRWWGTAAGDDPALLTVLASLRAIRDKRSGKANKGGIPVHPADTPAVTPVPARTAPSRPKLVFDEPEDEPYKPVVTRQRVGIKLEKGQDCYEEDGEFFDGIMASVFPLGEGDPDPDLCYSLPESAHDVWAKVREAALKLAREKGYEVIVVRDYNCGELMGEEFLDTMPFRGGAEAA